MIVARLKKGKERMILNGYPWVFRDELLSIDGPQRLGEVNVFSYDYGFLGRGFYNPESNRAVMVLTNRDEDIGKVLFKRRIMRALRKREALYELPYYRLIHGEGDKLPGLVVDRYGEILVVQFRNRIVQSLKETIIETLVEETSPAGIYERSDFEMGVEDKIDRNTGLLYGEVPKRIEVIENGLKFLVDIEKSQKTGFFFDQRESRAFCSSLVKKLSLKKGLDLFSFTGAFGINMAAAGAEVICVDKSVEDLKLAKLNSELNGLDKCVQFAQSDAIDFIGRFEKDDAFDIVVLDPPSLVKHRKELSTGVGLFRDMIKGLLPLVRDRGVLGICTCAYNIGLEHLVEAVRRSTENSGITFSHLAVTLQSPDHPWLMQVPESLYLKCLWGTIEKE
ncbi:MAG: class I SAM-dependent rRNA methyltransferase [Mesotoga sp.]